MGRVGGRQCAPSALVRCEAAALRAQCAVGRRQMADKWQKDWVRRTRD